MRLSLLIAAICGTCIAAAQCDRWQQHIQCDLTVDLDVRTHLFTGTEKLVYENNSPDTLRELYFHLYFNAFKPGSEMDVRSRTIADPDPRVGDRIFKLTPEEQGDLTCSGIRQDGRNVQLEPLGTVLRAGFGPDGALWIPTVVAGSCDPAVQRVTPAGASAAFVIPVPCDAFNGSLPHVGSLATGDGLLWYTREK